MPITAYNLVRFIYEKKSNQSNLLSVRVIMRTVRYRFNSLLSAFLFFPESKVFSAGASDLESRKCM